MAIISPVEAKTPQGRFLVFSIYLILVVGAVTVVYPFMMMLGVSIASAPDFQDYRAIPQYLYNDEVLLVKYLDEKFAQRGIFPECRTAFRLIGFEPKGVVDELDVSSFSPEQRRRLVDEWRDFKRSPDVPIQYKTGYFMDGWIGGRLQYRFHDWLRERYGDDVAAVNRALGLREESIEDISPPYIEGAGHRFRYGLGEQKFVAAWHRFLAEQPPRFVHIWNSDSLYHHHLERVYGTTDELNLEWGTAYDRFTAIPFPVVRPASGPEQPVWDHFIKKRWPLRFVRLGQDDAQRQQAAAAYRGFLAAKYRTIEAYNDKHGSTVASFDEAPVFHAEPEEDFHFADWSDFVDERVPVDWIVPVCDKTLWPAYLAERFGHIDRLNGILETGYASFEDVPMPRQADHMLDFFESKSEIRKRFLGVNYYIVLKYIMVQGRAFFNTLVLVVATIVTQLTIMPMAAFALSRFRLRYSHRILLFLLATMAFPGEVAMIPNFLLLKEFNLLNTYWALILPGVANGFGIFLLKGFFDSLPQELYEAGVIEGANELQLFRLVTLPMSKPILAVIALGGFQAAYGGFMWAYLICQKQEMWTIMVFLFDFQTRQSPPFQVMAALVLAAIPTLLVFIFCQKIIMRGIIIPTFK